MGIPQLPEGYTAEQIEIRQAPDSLIAEINDLQNAMIAETRPELACRPAAEAINEVRKLASWFEDWTLLVRAADGKLIGRAAGGVNRTGENEHLFEFELEILPGQRGRGLGRWALAQSVEAARRAGATLLMAWSDSAVEAGEAFAEKAGFELGLLERESDLVLANVDWSMVEDWVAAGPGRAPGYQLQFVQGRYPEELYDDVLRWQDVMNTAPRDAMEVNDEHGTRDQLREREDRMASSSKDRLEYIARHVASGEAVGGTNVFYEPWTPTVLWQGATAVHPDHRGHALGKWLKAAMLLKVRELLPEVEVIRTGNAYSNDPMLGINNKLGFKETRAYKVWQAPITTVLDRLGS